MSTTSTPLTDLEVILLPLKQGLEPTLFFRQNTPSEVSVILSDSPNNIQLVTITVSGLTIRAMPYTGQQRSWELCDSDSFDPIEFFQVVSNMILNAFISSTHQRLIALERYSTKMCDASSQSMGSIIRRPN